MAGERRPIDRIAVVAPVPSILTAARPLPDVDWSTGIAWTPGSCFPSYTQPSFCPPNDREDFDGDLGPATTVPFTIYTPINCEWLTAEAAARLESLATDLTEAHTAWGISRQLWLGDALPAVEASDSLGLPISLRRNAVDLSIAGHAAALDDIVSVMLAAYEACTGGLGGAILHVPTVLMVGALGGGNGGARVCWPEGNTYRGPLGMTVSPGPGYPHGRSVAGPDGFGPLVPASDPESYQGNGYDEAWVYMTGPVEYAVGNVQVLPEGEEQQRMPMTANQYHVWGQRKAIVRFDPCCVFAAKAINDSGERS